MEWNLHNPKLGPRAQSVPGLSDNLRHAVPGVRGESTLVLYAAVAMLCRILNPFHFLCCGLTSTGNASLAAQHGARHSKSANAREKAVGQKFVKKMYREQEHNHRNADLYRSRYLYIYRSIYLNSLSAQGVRVQVFPVFSHWKSFDLENLPLKSLALTTMILLLSWGRGL